ncbi:C69 family dipeptidase [Allokutzneria sp. A3M-2-11 16]|uniref:C69 family dipeptidase n=1 Tax=Allokutzneria sp. A3M-2-11 16 TaxID=2962043 RepID=UPI0020B81A32|nr:C69 family dipeptidase [Allokutzneria sp. A3M-2-11 16]MCP3803638.1 C69 family dipeptidase [Allokutzneria sp. A3M-2-11 16]
MRWAALILPLCLAVLMTSGPPAGARAREKTAPDKSFAVYVGKNLTRNGRPFLGGFGHEPSSHWIDIVPRKRHPEGSTIEVGATAEANIPGELTRIPQVPETARYITSNYSEFAGFPAPLTNGGLNEHGVAARDVWSPSRPEPVKQTPTPQRGPNYSDLSRIAMERARTAREAVEIVGGLIDRYGYTTYGGNSHLFADANEGWVLIEFAGGRGLWAAQRLGPDEVRVSYPGYIGAFPTTPGADHLSSPNLVGYAVDRGWWRPDSGQPFDLRAVYGTPFPGAPFAVGAKISPDDEGPYRHPPSLEAEFRRLAPVTLQDVMRIVRDPRWADDRAGYGHVAELDASVRDPELATLWVAVTSAVTAPYLPVHIGTRSVPPEYRQHRYLTHNSARTYLDPEFAEQEATEYATQTYKRLFYATCARPRKYLGQVTRALEGFEARILGELSAVERRAATAYASGAREEARRILTSASDGWAADGLALGGYLLARQLAESRADGGLRSPSADIPDMSLRGKVSARDRINCDLGGGWAEGGTLARRGSYGNPADVPDYRARPAGASAWWFVLAVAGGLIVGWFLRRPRLR